MLQPGRRSHVADPHGLFEAGQDLGTLGNERTLGHGTPGHAREALDKILVGDNSTIAPRSAAAGQGGLPQAALHRGREVSAAAPQLAT
jgi:hypothetical protein